MIYELFHTGFCLTTIWMSILYDISFRDSMSIHDTFPLIFLGKATDFVVAAKFRSLNDELTLTSQMIYRPSPQAVAKRSNVGSSQNRDDTNTPEQQSTNKQ
ncbi:putative uncharacterized protein C10orf128 homolog isoform X3 [Numida meleagris]|uniref:putative uncharacterized protein C10orf128 homolog isoform X3 n=1 Tax=Numida meleagris TaxID=8996 RepID=UPI000B3E236B|nr:putative uncharacterized protein C10orf128 homolog isoform X3 [Numida meleagris]